MPTPKSPIASVLFIHESGYVESYRPAEIRAAPDLFREIAAEHSAAGRSPLVMRSAPLTLSQDR